MKNLFKSYPQYEYKGLYSQLGIMETLIVLFDKKKN